MNDAPLLQDRHLSASQVRPLEQHAFALVTGRVGSVKTPFVILTPDPVLMDMGKSLQSDNNVQSPSH